MIWRTASSLVSLNNGLACGKVTTKTTYSAASYQRQMKTEAAQLAIKNVLAHACDIVRVRRDLGLTGVQLGGREAVTSLLKLPSENDGYTKRNRVKQISFIADRIVEPTSPHPIFMLDALPHDESCFYACESHVVQLEGKSQVIAKEIEQQYAFVGGEEREYIKYLERPDAKPLWDWGLTSTVKASAGLAAVLKKDEWSQRKLLMQCSANYWFSDVRERANLGMHGGGALSRCVLPRGGLCASACDEDSAFTAVSTPKWMHLWSAAPPLLASKVMHLLPQHLIDIIDDPSKVFVSPLYTRLAMGSSHAVHILMSINLHAVGKALHDYSALLSSSSAAEAGSCRETKEGAEARAVDENCVMTLQGNSHDTTYEDDAMAISDTHFNSNFTKSTTHAECFGNSDKVGEKTDTTKSDQARLNFSVDEWVRTVRQARRESCRVFVVMHLFAGPKRDFDIEYYLTQLCTAAGFVLLVLSCDLAVDPEWDLTNPITFAKLYRLCDEGLIDIIFGGPPCSTVTRARFLPGGPPPLRFRWCVWGKPDLKGWELSRVKEANQLWINFMSLSQVVASKGGSYGLEHPADPGCDPYPSIFITDELKQLEASSNACYPRPRFHQCFFGAPCPKLTEVSTNMESATEILCGRCPGISSTHVHAISHGKNSEGVFATRRLAQYPPKLCKAFATIIFKTICQYASTLRGPTGPLQPQHYERKRRHTAWNSDEEGQHSIALLNESVVEGKTHVLGPGQAAVYIHVDDTVVLGATDNPDLHSDAILKHIVHALERLGFGVSQVFMDHQLKRVVGYDVQRSPPRLELPSAKRGLLREALLGLAGQRSVDVSVLSSLMGLLIFGAILNRNLLAIPFHVYHFIEQYRDNYALLWPSVKAELVAMGHATVYMYCRLDHKLLPFLFATDAQGSGEGDFGGYGIVATKLTEAERKIVLDQSELPGRTVARVSELGGVKNASAQLLPTVPRSMLPPAITHESRWIAVESGRWRYHDHIVLGEARAVLKLLRRLAGHTRFHHALVISLQDNMPCSCGYAKGRSPSYPFLRILRQKASLCLATSIKLMLPWVESARQPADALSRCLEN